MSTQNEKNSQLHKFLDKGYYSKAISHAIDGYAKNNEITELVTHLQLVLDHGMKSGTFREISELIENQEIFTMITSLDHDSTAYGDLLCDLAVLARRIRLPQISQKLYLKSREVYKVSGSQRDLDKVSLNQANLDLSQGEFQNAYEKYQKLLKHDTSDETRALVTMNLGSCLYQMGDIEQAVQHYTKAISIFEELNDDKRLGHIFLNLGVIKLNTRQFEQALFELDRAIHHYNQTNDIRGAIIAQEQRLKVLISNNDNVKALASGRETLSKISPEKDYRLYARIAILLSRLLDPDQIRDEFFPYVNTVTPSLGDPPEVFQVLYLTTRELIRSQTHMELAHQRLTKLLEISSQLKDYESRINIQVQLAWLNYYQKNYQKVLQVVKRYNNSNDLEYQNKIDFALLSLLINRPKYSLSLMRNHFDPHGDWTNPTKFTANVIYLLASKILDREKPIIDSVKYLQSSPMITSHPSVQLLIRSLDIDDIQLPNVNEAIYQDIQSKIISEDNCKKAHLTSLKTNHDTDCSQECPNLYKMILENPPITWT